MENKEIVIFFLNTEWEREVRKPHIQAFTKYFDVVCIEYPINALMPFLKLKLFLNLCFNKIKPLQVNGIKFYRPVMLFPYALSYRYKIFEKINNLVLKVSFMRLNKQICNYEKKIVFIKYPQQSCVMNSMNEDVFCFECCDDHFRHTSDPQKLKNYVEKKERELVKKSDIVFNTAKKLHLYNSQINSHSFYIPNSADTDLFTNIGSANIPDDLVNIPYPRIGLIGNINEIVDIELLAYLATEKPDWSIVLIGSFNGGREFNNSCLINNLKKKNNVYILGLKPYLMLPIYQKYLDVCMLPYLINDYTDCVHPNKLYQYLAQRKPIVATDMKELVQFRDFVKISNTHEEFKNNIEDILAGEFDIKEKEEIIKKILDENSLDNLTKKKRDIIIDYIRE